MNQSQRLKTENPRLREDVAILKAATTFFAGELDPPQPLIMGFIEHMRSKGYTVESIIRVLREQGVKIATRTYRAWATSRTAAWTVTDTHAVDAIRDAAWTDAH